MFPSSLVATHGYVGCRYAKALPLIPRGQLQTPPLSVVQTLSLLCVCQLAEPMSMYFPLWQLRLASEVISKGLWFTLKASQSSLSLVVSDDTLGYLSPGGCFQHQETLITSSSLVYLGVRKCESYCSKCQKPICIEIIGIKNLGLSKLF